MQTRNTVAVQETGVDWAALKGSLKAPVAAEAAAAVADVVPPRIANDFVRQSSAEVHGVSHAANHVETPSADHDYWEGASSLIGLHADSSLL